MGAQKRLIWLDLLRIISIFCVVLIHSSSNIFYSFGRITDIQWMTGNLFDTLARASVPIFIMISGLLLLNPEKNESLSVFFKKRVTKILFPFLFWSIVYLFWNSYLTSSPLTFKLAIKKILTGTVYYHFWFMYTIIGLYLLAPIFRMLIKSLDKHLLSYFILICFTTASFFPFLSKFFGISINIGYSLGMVGYFVLGAALNKVEITPKLNRLCVSILVIMYAITSFGTYLLSKQGNAIDEYLYNYNSPNIVFMSAAVFILFMNLKNLTVKPNSEKVIKTLSDLSFGVYFIHVLVIDIINKTFGAQIGNLPFFPLVQIILLCAVTFTISAILIYCSKKIPLIKKIIA